MTIETLKGFMTYCWRQHDRLIKSGKAHFKRDALAFKTRALIYSDRIESATCS